MRLLRVEQVLNELVVILYIYAAYGRYTLHNIVIVFETAEDRIHKYRRRKIRLSIVEVASDKLANYQLINYNAQFKNLRSNSFPDLSQLKTCRLSNRYLQSHNQA